jgi:hypothetical protein
VTGSSTSARGGVGAVAFRLGDAVVTSRVRKGGVGTGTRSGYVGRRRVMVMDCEVVSVERHAGGGSTASSLRVQASRSSAIAYD